MSELRKAVTVFDESSSMTLLKPFSGEYLNYLIEIHEDAHGEMTLNLRTITELRAKFGDKEFDKILKKLEV